MYFFTKKSFVVINEFDYSCKTPIFLQYWYKNLVIMVSVLRRLVRSQKTKKKQEYQGTQE